MARGLPFTYGPSRTAPKSSTARAMGVFKRCVLSLLGVCVLSLLGVCVMCSQLARSMCSQLARSMCNVFSAC